MKRLIAAAAVAIAGAFGGYVPSATAAAAPHHHRIHVPNVVGLTRRQAVRHLRHIGLRPVLIANYVCDAEPAGPAGFVVDEMPAGGTRVHHGAHVVLVYNADFCVAP